MSIDQQATATAQRDTPPYAEPARLPAPGDYQPRLAGH